MAELNTANPKEIIKLIYERLLEVSDIPHIANIENITDSEIEEIQAWASAQYERASEIADIDTLPDVISFGETIVIKGIDSSKASLSIGDNQISPDEGSEEVIDICFSNGDENTTSGYIKLTVGYLNFDEDGGAADGISDEVEYEYHDILKELDNFIYAQNCLIEKDTRIAEIISEAIKTNVIGVVLVWKGAGYYMIIYLASLQSVSPDLIEAAQIDGASPWQRFKSITVPLISGAFTINFTLSLINGLKVFDQINVMTDGGPGFTSETLVYLLYKVGFNEGRQGFGTAVGIMLLFIIIILNTLQQKFLRSREVQM